MVANPAPWEEEEHSKEVGRRVADGNPLGSLLAGPREIGRHFTIVAGLSSLLVIGVPALLLMAGAPSRRPSLDAMGAAVGDLGFAGLAMLAVGVLIVGVVLQPLQFAFTQLLEGYWGPSAHGRRAMVRGVRAKQRRLAELSLLSDNAEETLSVIDLELNEIGSRINRQRYSADRKLLNQRAIELTFHRVAPAIDTQEAKRAARWFPDDPHLLMPTRLGNALRRHEALAGAPFGVEAVSSIAYLAQIGGQVEREYFDDSRTALDLAVRMVFIWSALGVSTFIILWRFDLWLLLPLMCLALALGSYHGAVAAAEQFGEAMAVLIGLNRHELYRRLGLAMPRSLHAERAMNDTLWSVLAGAEGDLPLAPHSSGNPGPR